MIRISDIFLSSYLPFAFKKLTNPCNVIFTLYVRSFSSFCLFLVFHVLRSSSGLRSKRSPRDEASLLSLYLSLLFSPSHFPRLPRSSSLFLAGQRLMDIHSNEVKAINNSGGNAYPHLVPFLLKSSVCNKRSSLSPPRKREKKKEK